VLPAQRSVRVILAGYSPKARQKVKQVIEEMAEGITNLS